MLAPRSLARRLIAAGTLSLVLSTAAAAELTKDQCYDARVALGGALYWRVAQQRSPDLARLRSDYEKWSVALELAGCPPWESTDELLLRAIGARLDPPAGFWDECGVEDGVCGGRCAVPFHQCQDVEGDCRCVSVAVD